MHNENEFKFVGWISIAYSIYLILQVIFPIKMPLGILLNFIIFRYIFKKFIDFLNFKYELHNCDKLISLLIHLTLINIIIMGVIGTLLPLIGNNYFIIFNSLICIIVISIGIIYILLGIKILKISVFLDKIFKLIFIFFVLFGVSGIIAGIIGAYPKILLLFPIHIVRAVAYVINPLLKILLFTGLGVAFLKDNKDLNKSVIT